MKILSKFAFAALSVATITLLLQTPITRLTAQGFGRQEQHRTLSLKATFVSSHSTQGNPNVFAIGDQLTYGGTLARFERPDYQIGDFGVHFVVTAPDGAEFLGSGACTLPDGKISFQMLVGPTDNPDVHGVITGGTGAYSNAGGEIIHHPRPNGDQEFIFKFSTD